MSRLVNASDNQTSENQKDDSTLNMLSSIQFKIPKSSLKANKIDKHQKKKERNSRPKKVVIIKNCSPKNN